MSIYKKLFDAKKEIGKISKDSTNPFYKSKYFDINQLLEHVEPILQKHGLLIMQPILNNKVRTIIFDTEKDGSLESHFVISELELTNQTDPQKRGSEITYYRRYTLGSLLGLQAEDDDANSTVKSKESTSGKPDDNKPWLNVGSKEWNSALEKGSTLEQLRPYFKISKANQEQYSLALIR